MNARHIRMRVLWFALLGNVASAALGNWRLVKLTEAAAEKGAVCLDGSPAAYYIRPPLTPPSGDAPVNQWLIFHEGGGWCNGDANCYDRSQTDLGSSKNYPAVMGPAEANDLYDALPAFTVVYAKYCDGSSLTGDRADPVMVGGNASQVIYYRGRRVLDALLDDLLDNMGLAAADTLLYAGCSAGALTLYSHLDYVATRVPATTPIVGMGDAMFSLQWRDFAQRNSTDPSLNYYTNQFSWGFEAWNASASVNQACRAHYTGLQGSSPGDAWVCFHGATAMRFVQTPTLVVNSKYDTWQGRGVLQLNTTECPGTVAADGTVVLCNSGMGDDAVAQQQYWLEYGRAMLGAMGAVDERHGAFLTNCPGHCATSGAPFRESAFPGTNLKAAVLQWLGEAVANGKQPGWKAPRWLAQEGQKCTYAPA